MRKRNAGRIALAVVLSVTMIWSGCSTNWIAQAEQIVSALIPAAANLVTLVAALQGKSVAAGDLATIQSVGKQAGADLGLIQSLIAAYQVADEASKPGILNQIQSAIQAVQGNLQGLLAGLHIKDAATQTKIAAVVGILLAEVESLEAIVPLVKASEMAGVRQAERRGLSPQITAHPRVPLTAGEFVKSYNSTLTAKTGNAELDRVTAGLQIHLHGKAERWASGGVLE